MTAEGQTSMALVTTNTHGQLRGLQHITRILLLWMPGPILVVLHSIQLVSHCSDAYKLNDDFRVTSTVQVDGVVKEEEGQEEASARAPVPLLSASEEDSKEGTSSRLSQDAGVGYRFFKLHLKSPTGWQVDAQVTTLNIWLL